MLNKVILLGRLGKEPELVVKDGKTKLKFTLATNRKDNKGKEKTAWHNIVFYGDWTNKLIERIGKGSLVYVEGRIEYFTTQDGNRVAYIVGDQIRICQGIQKVEAPQDDESDEFPW